MDKNAEICYPTFLRFTKAGDKNGKMQEGGRASMMTKAAANIVNPSFTSVFEPLGGLYGGKASTLADFATRPDYGVETTYLGETLKKQSKTPYDILKQVYAGIRIQEVQPNEAYKYMFCQILPEIIRLSDKSSRLRSEVSSKKPVELVFTEVINGMTKPRVQISRKIQSNILLPTPNKISKMIQK